MQFLPRVMLRASDGAAQPRKPEAAGGFAQVEHAGLAHVARGGLERPTGRYDPNVIRTQPASDAGGSGTFSENEATDSRAFSRWAARPERSSVTVLQTISRSMSK